MQEHKIEVFKSSTSPEAARDLYNAWAVNNNHDTGVEVQNITVYHDGTNHNVVVYYFERSL